MLSPGAANLHNVQEGMGHPCPSGPTELGLPHALPPSLPPSGAAAPAAPAASPLDLLGDLMGGSGGAAPVVAARAAPPAAAAGGLGDLLGGAAPVLAAAAAPAPPPSINLRPQPQITPQARGHRAKRGGAWGGGGGGGGGLEVPHHPHLRLIHAEMRVLLCIPCFDPCLERMAGWVGRNARPTSRRAAAPPATATPPLRSLPRRARSALPPW